MKGGREGARKKERETDKKSKGIYFQSRHRKYGGRES